MSDAPTRADDAIAVAPAPNWYGSSLADWGGADGSLCAYAARNVVVLVRPRDARARFAGALAGHANRVTAVAFARGPGADHLLVSGSADKHLRVWDTSARRCLSVLRGHAAEVSAVATSPHLGDAGSSSFGDAAAPFFVSADRAGVVLAWRLGPTPGVGDRPLRRFAALDATPTLAIAIGVRSSGGEGSRVPASSVYDVAVAQRSGALALFAFAPSADSPGSPLEPTRLPARAAEVHQLAWLPTIDDAAPSASGKQSPGPPGIAALAVGSAERGGSVTLWTWDGAKTTLRATLALPRPDQRPSDHGAHRAKPWVALAWSVPSSVPPGPGPPLASLLVASHGGELLRWRVDSAALLEGSLLGREQRDSASAPSDASAFERFRGAHDKAVFAVAPDPTGASVFTASHDRTFASRDVATLALEWRAAGLGGFAYALDLDPSSGRVAIGCGDGSVRILAEGGSEPERADGGLLSPDGGLLSPDGGLLSRDGGFLWRGLANAKVTCVAWAPADADERSPAPPGAFVAGLEDGRVVVVADARGGGGAAPRYAAQKDGHAGGVLALRWSEAEAGDGERGRSGLDPTGGRSYDLVSLGGDGRVWRWTALAAPAGSGGRRGVPSRSSASGTAAGGSSSGSPGEAAAFVDVTMRFHDRGTVEATSRVCAMDIIARGEGPDADPPPEAYVALGWSDGSVSAHPRESLGYTRGGGGSSLEVSKPPVAWRVREHAKRVAAVRWHPRAADAASPRRGWVASVSADGGFAVVGARGVVARSAPQCRHALCDVAWRPGPGGGEGDATAATAGADGVARVWDAAEAPTLVAACRGHEGRVLCVAWSADGRELVTGSDDQTVRRWDPEDPSRAPGAAAEYAAEERKAAKADKAKAKAADAAFGAEEEGAEGAGAEGVRAPRASPPPPEEAEADADANDSSGASPLGASPLGASPLGASSRAAPSLSRGPPLSSSGSGVDAAKRKKKRKGTGGRGLIKPPAWESTPEGIAAGREAAVALARILAARARVGEEPPIAEGPPPPLDAKRAGYGPEGLGLFLGQAEAMRLLEVEVRRGEDGEAAGAPRVRRPRVRRPTPRASSARRIFGSRTRPSPARGRFARRSASRARLCSAGTSPARRERCSRPPTVRFRTISSPLWSAAASTRSARRRRRRRLGSKPPGSTSARRWRCSGCTRRGSRSRR